MTPAKLAEIVAVRSTQFGAGDVLWALPYSL